MRKNYFQEKEECCGGNENAESGLFHKMTVINDTFGMENVTLINMLYYTDNCGDF